MHVPQRKLRRMIVKNVDKIQTRDSSEFLKEINDKKLTNAWVTVDELSASGVRTTSTTHAVGAHGAGRPGLSE